ncbi:c-type cytochrome biogenesis protein CcmI [Solimonas marina]|uniref:C-type cytochrome biogenesis protein CcmI n=1 Tax=Solimonas marina TaxID=2714601 RepID=A0A969W772_9GAMM|nr:c-type cytochrome biogenesis protein CcmI [Solimonas marina]NKF21672.1 c-type cytochrome biogenesis protein CcmI [Solimonas marina]
MTLYLLMALLAALAGLWWTRPLWRRASPAALRRRSANVGAYRTRLAEIDADVAAGTLDAEAAQQLRDEAAARLLDDAGAAEVEAGHSARRLPLALAGVAVLAVLSASAYWYGGSWRTFSLIELAGHDPQAAQERMVDGMIAKLQAHLDAEPDDAQGWAMLGRSYVVLQRYADGAKAYGRANALTIDQPHADWLVAAGAALGMADGNRDLSKGRPLFEQALKLEPGNAEALWYGGLAALQDGDFKTTYAHWLKLRDDRSLPDDVRAILDQHLPELATKAGETLPAAADASPQAPASGVHLTVEVSLADALKDKLKPGMTLLVFAKAASGPPMPLAVQKISSPKLPLTVTLDDSLAMMPAMKLSAFPNWVVTARLTSSGGAQALSGDLEGSHPVARADAATPLQIVIDRQLP